MYEIDGIRIDDANYDKVCLNCRYWQVNVQLRGAANGMVCNRGQGQTNPMIHVVCFLQISQQIVCKIRTGILTKGIRWTFGSCNIFRG